MNSDESLSDSANLCLFSCGVILLLFIRYFTYPVEISLKKLKNMMATWTFIPLLYLVLQNLTLPSQWNCIYSFSVPLICFPVIFILGIILIYVEAFGGKIKLFKYYHCSTFFVYEFIGFVTIFAYINKLVANDWSVENDMKAVPWLEVIAFDLKKILIILIYPSTWFMCSINWIKNSSVHFELMWCKIFNKKPKTNQYEYSLTTVILWKIINLLFIYPTFIYAYILFFFEPIAYIKFSNPFDMINWVGIVYFYGHLLIMIFVYANLEVSRRHINNLPFLGPDFLKGINVIMNGFCPLLMLITILNIFRYHRVDHSGFVSWLSWLSICRQWFLHMELNPEKYENLQIIRAGEEAKDQIRIFFQIRIINQSV